MKWKLAFLLIGILVLTACSNHEAKTGDSTGPIPINTIQKPKTVSEFEPDLFKADSLQVIYYDDPDGDLLRYSRYFTYTESGDTAVIQPLLKEMDQVFVQQAATRKCRSEGKLYLLKGEEVSKTLYFSTKKDPCSYFYFIKDGAFIYFPLTENAETWLSNNRENARKPATAN